MPQVFLIADQKTPLLDACGATLQASTWLSEDAPQLLTLLDTPGEPLLLCSGSPHQQSPALAALLQERLSVLPGFGETLRRGLSVPACITTDVMAGYTQQGRLVVSLSAEPSACGPARTLIEALLPDSSETALEAAQAVVPSEDSAGQTAAPPPAADPSTIGRVAVSATGAGTAPQEDDTLIKPWAAGLAAREATLDRERWYALPDEIAEQAAVCDVLRSAGERAAAVLPDGRTVGVFGYPDLRRPGSKVLMLTVTRGVLEAVALHRHPHVIGITGRETLLRCGDLDREAVRRTGRPTPFGGMLFAVTHNAVYLERDEQIYRWDGSREHKEGSETQATASLLLRWSAR